MFKFPTAVILALNASLDYAHVGFRLVRFEFKDVHFAVMCMMLSKSDSSIFVRLPAVRILDAWTAARRTWSGIYEV